MTAVIDPFAARAHDARAMVDFDRSPFLVIWEVTRACALACVHCRADAIARRDPRELRTEEGRRLIEQVRAFGTPPKALEGMAARVAELPLTLWAVFFLVQTGRGKDLEQITAEECEEALAFLDGLSRRVPFGIKTTEAPHYRRVQAQRAAAGATTGPVLGRKQLRARRAVNDGNGFVFVDHVGNVCPSGFLPMPRGNVRDRRLVEIYRDDEVFRRLRDPGALGGRCARCEFRTLCGGSRSRAYAATGDAFAEDPLCAFEPDEGAPLTARASG
jgi:radical SAM protein with 4Fe4S-binding SPASM domain